MTVSFGMADTKQARDRKRPDGSWPVVSSFTAITAEPPS